VVLLVVVLLVVVLLVVVLLVVVLLVVAHLPPLGPLTPHRSIKDEATFEIYPY
jgi:hypothetical protein